MVPVKFTKRVKIALGCLALAGIVAVAPLALAQQGPGGHPPHGEMGPGPHFKEMCDNLDAHRAAMLAFAEAKLGITADERAAWTKFAEQVKAAQAPIEKACADPANAAPLKTLPEHLAQMEQMTDLHAAVLRQLRPAIEAMYAQLTPAQKAIADHMIPHGPGPMHEHH